MNPTIAANSEASTSRREREAQTSSAMALLEVATGYWLPRCLHVVADLGVADALDDKPRSAAELARAVKADPDSLDRVLRLLASHGIFERRDGNYAHNELSRALRTDHPHSVRAYVRLVGLPVFWNSYGLLEQVIRTGEPAVNTLEPGGIFAYFKDHAEECEVFDAGMKAKAETAIWPVLDACDFSPFGTIADVGGGLGHLLKAILKAAPKTRGVLFDQAHVVERVAPADRLDIQGGDFFRGPLPRCDAYILMEVIHDWNDEQSKTILQQIRKAAPAKAKLLIVETVLPDETIRHFGYHLDIQMMVVTGGRERTVDEFSQLFQTSGFQLTQVTPTQGPYSIVEGIAV
jgi:O-methyltransferase domain/Dimerisation domain